MTTLEETPHILSFDRRASLPVDFNISISCIADYVTWLEYPRRTVENLPLVYEIARANLQERTDQQTNSDEKWLIPHNQPGCQVFIHCPCTLLMGPVPYFCTVPGVVPVTVIVRS